MRSIDKINYYLKLRGEDAVDLSGAIGVSTSAISQWNNGKTAPSNKSLKKAADYFNIDVSMLFDDGKEIPAAHTGDGITNRLSGLDADLQETLIEFVELAQANPETAKRFLAFAVQELRSSAQAL